MSPMLDGAARTCGRCARVNPGDAAFCYHDGCPLDGPTHAASAAAAQTFSGPFVFPSGRRCRTFGELALGCQEEWDTARDLLTRDHLASFLDAAGRPDLAGAARAAARWPDADRGLDRFLCQLPTDVLDVPRLLVHPRDVSLGETAVGTDRHFDLHLENTGMRLLHGTVAVEGADWLALGETGGTGVKLFQCTVERIVPVHVRGQRLRAGMKPLEGRLVVESNGGNATVRVRVEVPIEPFPEGVLAGARTPRQIAEKARVHPRQAAGLFESGAVTRWYRQNGWAYPVRGPTASGVAAIQQFFEVLGLTPVPRVEMSPLALERRGLPGDRFEETLTLTSPQRRPVYARAAGDQAWLEIDQPRLNGRSATITVRINVPEGGETLFGRIAVVANGDQRFLVPVTLEACHLGLAADEAVRKGVEFRVSAAVTPPLPGRPVRLVLPRDLSLTNGQDEEQTLGPTEEAVVWRVRAEKVGTFKLRATSGQARAQCEVRVQPRGLFG